MIKFIVKRGMRWFCMVDLFMDRFRERIMRRNCWRLLRMNIMVEKFMGRNRLIRLCSKMLGIVM